jgi:ketosteroid isomerase-like protein
MEVRVVRRMLALPFLLVALTGFARAQETARRETDEAAKAEVLKVSAQFDAAREAKDRAALERILADGLSWTARGDRLNKAQVIADIFSNNLHFKFFAHDSLAASAFGNTVVLTGHSTSVLEYKGKLFDAPRLFTDVYVKMDGRWQMVVHHVSDLAKP